MKIPADIDRALALGGETGERIRQFDWTSHPLGPISQWSPAVRTIVAATLPSRFPIVVWLGKDLHLLYNDAYIPMLGAKHPDALGRRGQDVWWDIWDVIGPMLHGVVASGVATWSDDQLLMLFRDGYREEGYFTFTYGPIVEVDGSIAGVFCAVNETTERVLSERRLATLRDLAAALADAPSVAAVTDATITTAAAHVADARFLALYLRDDQGASLAGATPNIRDLATQAGARLEAWGDVDPISVEPKLIPRIPTALTARTTDAEAIAGQAFVHPIVDAGAEAPMGWLVVGLNRHRRFDDAYRTFCGLLAGQVAAAFANARAHEHERQRAEALAELNRAKTAFFSNVSHEFRTPLTLMLGPLQEVRKGIEPSAQAVHDQLETVDRNARRLHRLVNSLLDFTRVEAGRTTASFSETDVGTFTADLASVFQSACERAGLALNVECEPAVAYVDRAMWETIVLNLISNAFKFTFAGSITVTVRVVDDGEVEVSVRDTGVGIPGEDLPHLFERFYRADATRGRSFEGSGIGLSLVRELVELHGGRVALTSEVDAGTTVTVSVPIGSAHLDPAALVPPTSVVSEASHTALVAADAYAAEALQWIETTTDELTTIPDDGRPLILVVDDNADMRRYFVRALSPRWRVATASRGEDALAVARVNPPDLIVTDVMMPGLDGLELVEAVRADAKLADIPMVVVSARAGHDAAVEGLARGADDYIVKPFTAQTLVERVNAVLRGARRATLTIDEHERHQRRARAFNGLARALAEASTVDDAVRALLYARELLRFDKPSIALVDKRRNILRVHQWAPSPSQAVFERNVNQPLDGDMPYALTVNSNDVVTVQDWRTESRFRPAVEDALASGYLSDVSVPLRDLSGDAFGALGFALTEPHEFVNDELDDVNSIAVMVARAVDRILRAEREHEIATVLQDELLEVERRSTTAAVCARYVASTQMLRVGGDWYTATVPGPGHVSVSVGDVVGSGVRAAAVMAQLRTAITAASLAMEDPVAVLDAVNRYASSLDDAYLSTAAYALIDHDRQRVSYACAGHPYPLLVGPDGAVQLLDGGRREPLGITRESESVLQAGVCPFPPGSLLLLYTDGLVERRGETLDDGLARLCDVVARQRVAPGAVVCDSIIAGLCPTEGFHDDVAIVAVRPAGVTREGFVDAVEASAANYAPLRHRLREWLGELGVDPQLERDIVLAVGEALVNAIEHGSNQLNAGQVVTVEAFVDGRELVVGVTDGGQWNADTTRSRRMNTRGRGLVLMYALMDEVDIRRSRQGTTVVMRRRLDGVAQELMR